MSATATLMSLPCPSPEPSTFYLRVLISPSGHVRGRARLRDMHSHIGPRSEEPPVLGSAVTSWWDNEGAREQTGPLHVGSSGPVGPGSMWCLQCHVGLESWRSHDHRSSARPSVMASVQEAWPARARSDKQGFDPQSFRCSPEDRRHLRVQTAKHGLWSWRGLRELNAFHLKLASHSKTMKNKMPIVGYVISIIHFISIYSKYHDVKFYFYLKAH